MADETAPAPVPEEPKPDQTFAPLAPEPTPPSVTSFDLTLGEFCSRLSTRDTRVELISAFHYTESKILGSVKDSEAAFQARFADFVNAPTA